MQVWGASLESWIVFFKQKERQILIHILKMGASVWSKYWVWNDRISSEASLWRTHVSLLPLQLPMPGPPILADVSTQKGPCCKIFKSSYRLFQGTIRQRRALWLIVLGWLPLAEAPERPHAPIALRLNLPSLFSRVTLFMMNLWLAGLQE